MESFSEWITILEFTTKKSHLIKREKKNYVIERFQRCHTTCTNNVFQNTNEELMNTDSTIYLDALSKFYMISAV